MQASLLDFNVSQFKTAIEEIPSKENGWKLQYEGKVSKKFSGILLCKTFSNPYNSIDSTMKVYQKKLEGSQYTVRVDADVRGVKAENLILMMRDVELRKKGLNPPKEMVIIEQTKNTDVVYFEVDLPFPFTNRDFVQKRLFVNNKEDPEVIKKLGLYDWDHAYHAAIIHNTEREEYPVKSKPIRGETKLYNLLLEEDVNDRSVMKMKLIFCQDLKGDIPKIVMKSLGDKVPLKLVEDMLISYGKTF